MPKIYKEFGENIRKYRKNKKLSTPEFAKRIGVSTGLVNNIENGRHDVFKLELIFKMAAELDVSLIQLLDITSINLDDLALLEELNSTLTKDISDGSKRIHELNKHLNKIIKTFILVAAKYDCNEEAINYISNHLIEQLNFIKKLDNFNAKVPVS
ncbi:helix-turn-helix domain-containing protein [Sporosalibacterium faouarense]|uniref:helix-turn-helix domain-containing protein n=1 Tax=Sporosalibacterium faouarense TaxID=516123 RepID=UPI00192B718F|nr:helix-turn-helix transcriptional regulator [Sporosalibacterium faouarense]